MLGYFLKTLSTRIAGAKSLYLLTVGGVALGVASVLCIQIINQNALAAFVGSVRAVSGEADFSLVGRTPTLPTEILPEIMSEPGVTAVWPIYRVDVSLMEKPDMFLEVLGVDFFAPARLPLFQPENPESDQGSHSQSESAQASSRLADVLKVPGWVAISPVLAKQMNWSVGDSVKVSSGSQTTWLHIGAMVDFRRYVPTASSKLAVMDIAQVQALLGQSGEATQFDISLAEDVDREKTAARLLDRLGSLVRVITPEQREKEAAGLLAAFRLNLTALSLISLFVGVFLVTTSIQASLVRRRSEFGLLRSLGATPQQVLWLILSEAILLGILGTAIGLPLGYWVAEANVDKVSGTLTNIYLLEEIETLTMSPWLFLLAIMVGVGGAMGGALLPALDTSRRDTHSLLAAFSLHERTGRLAPRLAWLALLLTVLTLIWFFMFGQQLRWSGFVLAFILIVVLPLLTPLFLRVFCGRVQARSLGLSYSLKNLVVRLQTTSAALAALAVTVSMLMGITLLIGSFRHTLDTWIDTSLRADVYITTESWARAGEVATLSPVLVDSLRGQPGVAASEWLRQFWAYTGERRIRFGGLAMNLEARQYRIPLLSGNPEEVYHRLVSEDATLISEPLARKAGLAVGDSLPLFTPGGEVKLPIVGISYDYSNENGGALVHLNTLEKLFGPGPVQNLALYLDAGVDVEHVVDSLKAQFRHWPLLIRSNQQLRAEVLDIFDQTFAITRILQFMALLIAASGISLTLIILARERVAELALYRSLGARRRQIFRIFLGEGLGLGILGLVLGLVGGVALAAILIFIINRAYFGWTIRPDWPVEQTVEQAITILAAAVVASVYPALRASRTPAGELSRDDL